MSNLERLNKEPNAPHVSLISQEKWVNKFIQNIYKFRILIVTLIMIAINILGYFTWSGATIAEKLKNFITLLGGASIIIGIFYSILNYENNQIKIKNDSKVSKEILTFSTATKSYDSHMTQCFAKIHLFYDENINLLQNGQHGLFEQKINADIEVKSAWLIVLNYFECICAGIDQGIMDEEFMREFFQTIFKNYQRMFSNYIDYLRRERKTERIFSHFTQTCQKWIK
ncbi:MAG TPA: DUF4760 domain-containing protein [Arachidicoccus sp.]|nr:DUF4760 domain-containing protein [Arachidicoccus sp.]